MTDLIEHRGTTHALLEYGGETFSVRAKDYRYQGKASFGLEQVEEAAENGYVLLSYVQEDKSLRVYDAPFLLDTGTVYEQPSQKSVSREWIEMDADYGVTLADYVNGRAEPRSRAGDNATLGKFY
ncbi:hypothetical protein [Halospeciosus flavus]|uniref:Uncharacterized protein n=1 Tax=Halospeciosus flavus TaxID=3032283 RepID=A0ABD5Z2W2_9EURY|nr:hypothetical protein [Halospeciosus flavus]